MAIVSKYSKPCLIVRRNSKDLLQGSARGNENFASLPNLKEYLEQSGYFEYAAGHENAFGAGFDANKLENFINYINNDLPVGAFENCYLVDYILNANDNNEELLMSLACHPEYFGNHIDEVKVVVKNIPMANIMAMGANKDSMKIGHNNISYVRFKDLDFVESVFKNRTKTLTVYGRLNLNTFAGQTNVQVFIDDYSFEENSSKYDF